MHTHIHTFSTFWLSITMPILHACTGRVRAVHAEMALFMLGLCKVNLESKGILDIYRGLINLPGWCWAEIQQFALVGSSSSLHSEACNALGASDGVSVVRACVSVCV